MKSEAWVESVQETGRLEILVVEAIRVVSGRVGVGVPVGGAGEEGAVAVGRRHQQQ